MQLCMCPQSLCALHALPAGGAPRGAVALAEAGAGGSSGGVGADDVSGSADDDAVATTAGGAETWLGASGG